ncbi:hypothetical protein VTH82DRAFT_8630 [Thermothelomyces myriococcoides]
MAIDSPPSDDEHQHSSEAYTSDVSDDTSFDPVYPRRGRRSPSSPNPYRPSVPVHPASRPLHDLTPDPGNDWELTSLSQLTPVELTQLITSAGLRTLGGGSTLEPPHELKSSNSSWPLAFASRKTQWATYGSLSGPDVYELSFTTLFSILGGRPLPRMGGVILGKVHTPVDVFLVMDRRLNTPNLAM